MSAQDQADAAALRAVGARALAGQRGGLGIIDPSADRQRFFDEAALRNAAARGSWSPRRGYQGDDVAVAAAGLPIRLRARAEQTAAEQAGADNRAAMAERAADARLGVVNAQNQTQNALAERRLDLESQRLGIETGKAFQTANKDAIQQAKDTQDIFGIIGQARGLLPQATNSTVGNAVDQVAGALGVSTKGAETAAQLKALQGSLVAKMPKMSGPQSDKDVLLYREMAGQIGDPTIPYEQRQKALDTVQQLHQKYLPAPTDAAGVSALSSGSFFRAPDGSIRRIP